MTYDTKYDRRRWYVVELSLFNWRATKLSTAARQKMSEDCSSTCSFFTFSRERFLYLLLNRRYLYVEFTLQCRRGSRLGEKSRRDGYAVDYNSQDKNSAANIHNRIELCLFSQTR